MLACVGVLALGAGQAGALPLVPVERAPGLLLAQAVPPASEQRAGADQRTPLSDLNEVLGATRAKIEELTRATAAVTADAEQRNELQALKKDRERLAAELEQASARRAELERAAELAEARVAELRQQNEQFDQSLARADAAREAALAELEDVRADTARKLGAAADEVERLRAELAGRGDELEATRGELADAKDVREQLEARVVALERVVERSGADTGRLQTELAEAKAQLDQAAGAAVEAERARQAAVREAEALRVEAERALEELAAAQDERARLEAARAELEEQMASLQTEWRSATEAARHNLMVMEEKIEALNAALELARPEGVPPTEPVAAEDQPDAASEAPSAIVQPPAPEGDRGTDSEEPATSAGTLSVIGVTAARAETGPIETATVALEKLIDSLPEASPATGTRPDEPIMTDAEIEAALADARPAEPAAAEEERDVAPRPPSPVEQLPAPEPADDASADRMTDGADQDADGATELAMVDPDAPAAEDDSELASFQANVRSLNQLERSAAGADLFSGVESVNGREVSVGATTAWNSLPSVGQQSYLDYLLEAWVAAVGREGAAAVRIVDPSGQVLVQKSRP